MPDYVGLAFNSVTVSTSIPGDSVAGGPYLLEHELSGVFCLCFNALHVNPSLQ
jgi:hypothetical protein